jgi:hypothetical protein
MTDEAIADLRDLRHQISPEFDHDPQKYIAYLQPQNYKYATQMELYQQLVQSSVPLTQPREDGVAPPRPRHPPPLPGGLADADDSVGEMNSTRIRGSQPRNGNHR